LLPELRRLVVKAYLKRLSLDDKPILVGPWRSEVGFEAMYWLPFLSWCAKRIPRFVARSVIVTRGGAANLYGQPVNIEGQTVHAFISVQREVDLYALRSVTDVRRENLYDWSRTKLQKQTQVTKWDRLVLAEAADRVLGARVVDIDVTGAPMLSDAKYHILHPSWMYWALQPFWGEERGLAYLLSMTDYTPLPRPHMSVATTGIWTELPKKFVALKFYGRATFPWPHPETARFVAELAGIIAAQTDVVLLDSGHAGDDHGDIPLEGPHIHRLPTVPPEQNLALQAAVLGKATAFVGTYGGMAQLALRMRVPSVSFYTEWGGTAHAHLSLSSYLSKMTKTPFLCGSIADAELWRQVVSLPVKVASAA
jgi:hypothetical protein